MPLSKETAHPPAEFAVVDLFAGPGGLAEGFSAVRDSSGNHPFKIVLSVEKEKAAGGAVRGKCGAPAAVTASPGRNRGALSIAH